MARLSLDLPESLAAWVEEQATARGYDSPGAFVRDVLEQHLDQATERERLRALVREGLESGETDETLTDIWAESLEKARQIKS